MSLFTITHTPIDLNTLLRQTATDEDGGIVIFLGTVRRHTAEKEVASLAYEAYPAMAVKSFEKIAEKIRSRWGVERLSIVHRVGQLAVGETAVVVIAASPHRREAFKACQFAIDQLKTISPIWKKELEVSRV